MNAIKNKLAAAAVGVAGMIGGATAQEAEQPLLPEEQQTVDLFVAFSACMANSRAADLAELRAFDDARLDSRYVDEALLRAVPMTREDAEATVRDVSALQRIDFIAIYRAQQEIESMTDEQVLQAWRDVRRLWGEESWAEDSTLPMPWQRDGLAPRIADSQAVQDEGLTEVEIYEKAVEAVMGIFDGLTREEAVSNAAVFSRGEKISFIMEWNEAGNDFYCQREHGVEDKAALQARIDSIAGKYGAERLWIELKP